MADVSDGTYDWRKSRRSSWPTSRSLDYKVAPPRGRDVDLPLSRASRFDLGQAFGVAFAEDGPWKARGVPCLTPRGTAVMQAVEKAVAEKFAINAPSVETGLRALEMAKLYLQHGMPQLAREQCTQTSPVQSPRLEASGVLLGRTVVERARSMQQKASDAAGSEGPPSAPQTPLRTPRRSETSCTAPGAQQHACGMADSPTASSAVQTPVKTPRRLETSGLAPADDTDGAQPEKSADQAGTMPTAAQQGRTHWSLHLWLGGCCCGRIEAACREWQAQPLHPEELALAEALLLLKAPAAAPASEAPALAFGSGRPRK